MLMPHLCGDALAERVRARRPSLPVVFMSANPRHHDAGKDGVPLLGKPFEKPALAEKLNEAFAASRRL